LVYGEKTRKYLWKNSSFESLDIAVVFLEKKFILELVEDNILELGKNMIFLCFQFTKKMIMVQIWSFEQFCIFDFLKYYIAIIGFDGFNDNILIHK